MLDSKQQIPFTIFDSTGLLTTLHCLSNLLSQPKAGEVSREKKEIVKTVNESLTNTDLQGFKSPATEIAI